MAIPSTQPLATGYLEGPDGVEVIAFNDVPPHLTPFWRSGLWPTLAEALREYKAWRRSLRTTTGETG